MGIYGNRFIEREVTLEDAIIQFESECNQYSKIFESINILNESGIILEFSFKDIIEKIKDFFRMIGRKIKELWNKIFHRKENIDEKKEKEEIVSEVIKEAMKDMSEKETDDEKEEETSNNKEGSHHIKGIKFFKEVNFKRSGKPVKAKIRIKLSKKELIEKKFKYKLLDINKMNLNEFNEIPFSFTYLQDILEECENVIEANKIEKLDEKLAKCVERNKPKVKSILDNIIQNYDNSKFSRIEVENKEDTFDKAKEEIVKQFDRIVHALNNCRDNIQRLNKSIDDREKKNYNIPEAVLNSSNKRLLMWINTAAQEDIKNIKSVLVACNKYLSSLMGIYDLVVNNLHELNAQAAVVEEE